MDRHELYNKLASRKFKSFNSLPYDGNNRRINRCINFMRSGKIRIGGTLLDVGGGVGDLGYAVHDLFEKRITVDISSIPLVAALEKGNEIICIDVDRDGLKGVHPNEIDTIVALDVIEHIIDPENFAKECAKVLKPNGEVFINTPNIRFWKHIEQLVLHGIFPHTSGDKEVFHGGHLAFYTYSDLKQIFEQAGFISTKQFMDDEYVDPPSWIMNMLHKCLTSQEQYVQLCLEFGCPNLLYKAILK